MDRCDPSKSLTTRLAVRELINHRRFSLFFILNLALGFFGFLALDAFKQSVEATLAARSRQILGADLTVSARRPFTPSERAALKDALPDASGADVIELYSMLASPAGSRLVEITAIGDGFPFYGEIRLAGGDRLRGGPALPKRSIWVQKELAAALRSASGDRLKLGTLELTVRDVIESDGALGAQGFSLAWRAYIPLSDLLESGLLQRGSTATHERAYRLPEGLDVDALAASLSRQLPDPGVRVRPHTNASRMVGRLQGFLNDYLGLAALASLFLSSIGAAYLFRTSLARRVRDIAILISLGLSPRRARQVYAIQLALLGAAAAGLSGLLVVLLLPVAISSLGAFVAYPIEVSFSLFRLTLALLLGGSAGLLVCLPFLWRLGTLKPSALFQEDASPQIEWTARSGLLAGPGVLLFWALAVWQAKSWITGSAFVGLFLGSAVILAGLGGALMSALEHSPVERHVTLRLALRHLSRSRVSTLAGFLAIGLGTALLNIIPQVQKSLQLEVEAPDVSEVPSLFVFDIQPEQVESLKRYLAGQGQTLQSLSPLIRARLSAVNGSPFVKERETGGFRTREEETQTRFRNRGMNLTWRAALIESEQIVEGRDFSQRKERATGPGDDPLPEISVEKRFAKRLGLRIGDIMSFDVQGVEIQGRIVNFRSVRWTSFQPNFFVQFAPGALEEAPATWLASIGRTDTRTKIRLQDGLVERFPNVSTIDVSLVVERLSRSSIRWAGPSARWRRWLFLRVLSFCFRSPVTRPRCAGPISICSKCSGRRFRSSGGSSFGNSPAWDFSPRRPGPS